jgi:hypothetical protein
MHRHSFYLNLAWRWNDNVFFGNFKYNGCRLLHWANELLCPPSVCKHPFSSVRCIDKAHNIEIPRSLPTVTAWNSNPWNGLAQELRSCKQAITNTKWVPKELSRNELSLSTVNYCRVYSTSWFPSTSEARQNVFTNLSEHARHRKVWQGMAWHWLTSPLLSALFFCSECLWTDSPATQSFLASSPPTGSCYFRWPNQICSKEARKFRLWRGSIWCHATIHPLGTLDDLEAA